jgi:predicted nucleic acid-binding protein
MAASPGILLDTNILVHLLRGDSLGKWLTRTYPLDKSLSHCLICVVTAGELLSLARQWEWGKDKKQRLQKALDELVLIDINHPDILEAYGMIDHFSVTTSKQAGKNDVWIAAVANVTGATLLTSDRYFDSLHSTYLNRIYVDPAAGDSA